MKDEGLGEKVGARTLRAEEEPEPSTKRVVKRHFSGTKTLLMLVKPNKKMFELAGDEKTEVRPTIEQPRPPEVRTMLRPQVPAELSAMLREAAAAWPVAKAAPPPVPVKPSLAATILVPDASPPVPPVPHAPQAPLPPPAMGPAAVLPPRGAKAKKSPAPWIALLTGSGVVVALAALVATHPGFLAGRFHGSRAAQATSATTAVPVETQPPLDLGPTAAEQPAPEAPVPALTPGATARPQPLPRPVAPQAATATPAPTATAATTAVAASTTTTVAPTPVSTTQPVAANPAPTPAPTATTAPTTTNTEEAKHLSDQADKVLDDMLKAQGKR